MGSLEYLLAALTPLNLLLFMAIPVVLAETLAITEFYILYNNVKSGPVRALNRAAGIIVGCGVGGYDLALAHLASIPH